MSTLSTLIQCSAGFLSQNYKARERNKGNLLKTIYRFNVIPIKISNVIFYRNRKINAKHKRQHKRLWIVKAILNKKINAGGIIILDFKLNYKTSVTKNSMVLAQKLTWRPVEQNRSKSTQLQPSGFWWCCLFNKWYWENWISTCRRWKLDSISHPEEKSIQNGSKILI
jgi:hypothetical protein